MSQPTRRGQWWQRAAGAVGGSDYYRHIYTLLSGSALSQLVLVAATPVLSRLYSPSEFGVYASFLAVCNIASMLASGRYEVAILLPRKHRDGIGLFLAGALLAAMSCLALQAAMPALRHSRAMGALLNEGLLPYTWLMPAGIFFFALTRGSSYLAMRFRHYRALSYSRVGESGTTATGAIALAWAAYAGNGLLLGKMLGFLVEAAANLWPSRQQLRQYWPQMSLARLRVLMYRYRNFPFFSTPEGLLNTGFKQLPVLALSALFSNELAGLFGMANVVLAKPLGMIGSAFGQVFFQQAAQLSAQSPGALPRLFRQNLRLLLALALVPCFLIAAFAPTLFALVLGESWRYAGTYSAWLVPFLLVTFLKAPFSSLIDIKNRLRQNLAFELSFFAAAALAFYYGHQSGNDLLAVQLYSLSCAAIGSLQLWWFYRLAAAPHAWQ